MKPWVSRLHWGICMVLTWIGLTSATQKGNRDSILKNIDGQEEEKLVGAVPKTSSKNEIADLEEKYNEWFANVNQLSERKVELVNHIKLKTNNKEMMRKARYAATGGDTSVRKALKSGGTSFTLIHVAAVFVLFFLIGLYYGKS